jgi:hypothetical protein
MKVAGIFFTERSSRANSVTAVRATRREHDLDEGGLAGAVRADHEVETHRVRYSSRLVVPSGW